MLVVSNTSPISNLAIIGRLELLRERYGEVVIPPAVEAELVALSHQAGRQHVVAALSAGWLKVHVLPPEAIDLRLPLLLDPGETEALKLGMLLNAGKLILDDALARRAASELRLPFTGLLGELVFAKQSGTVESVKAEISSLRSKARFFVSADVEAVILSAAGE